MYGQIYERAKHVEIFTCTRPVTTTPSQHPSLDREPRNATRTFDLTADAKMYLYYISRRATYRPSFCQWSCIFAAFHYLHVHFYLAEMGCIMYTDRDINAVKRKWREKVTASYLISFYDFYVKEFHKTRYTIAK